MEEEEEEEEEAKEKRMMACLERRLQRRGDGRGGVLTCASMTENGDDGEGKWRAEEEDELWCTLMP